MKTLLALIFFMFLAYWGLMLINGVILAKNIKENRASQQREARKSYKKASCKKSYKPYKKEYKKSYKSNYKKKEQKAPKPPQNREKPPFKVVKPENERVIKSPTFDGETISSLKGKLTPDNADIVSAKGFEDAIEAALNRDLVSEELNQAS